MCFSVNSLAPGAIFGWITRQCQLLFFCTYEGKMPAWGKKLQFPLCCLKWGLLVIASWNFPYWSMCDFREACRHVYSIAAPACCWCHLHRCPWLCDNGGVRVFLFEKHSDRLMPRQPGTFPANSQHCYEWLHQRLSINLSLMLYIFCILWCIMSRTACFIWFAGKWLCDATRGACCWFRVPVIASWEFACSVCPWPVGSWCKLLCSGNTYIHAQFTYFLRSLSVSPVQRDPLCCVCPCMYIKGSTDVGLLPWYDRQLLLWGQFLVLDPLQIECGFFLNSSLYFVLLYKYLFLPQVVLDHWPPQVQQCCAHMGIHV